MDVNSKNYSIILRIYEYCTEIDETISYFGEDYETFIRNKIYRNATTM
jgi:hypothetical protein